MNWKGERGVLTTRDWSETITSGAAHCKHRIPTGLGSTVQKGFSYLPLSPLEAKRHGHVRLQITTGVYSCPPCGTPADRARLRAGCCSPPELGWAGCNQPLTQGKQLHSPAGCRMSLAVSYCEEHFSRSVFLVPVCGCCSAPLCQTWPPPHKG